MMRFLYLILVLPMLALNACSSSPEPVPKTSTPVPQSDSPDEIPVGEVVRTMSCLSDPSNTYSFYIPKSKSAGKKHPVVLFFDAHARGTLPLEKYKALAERYGFIITCSNNSKNGLDVGAVLSISSAYFSDVLKRLPVDTHNIFAGGFSGGARVALGLAMQDDRIKGVIANSAGFDPMKTPLRKEVCFVGLVGNEDFNLAEMKATQAALNQTSTVNDLLIFNGKHEWAPDGDMDKAFLLLSLEGIRSGRLAKNDSILNASFRTDQREAGKILSGKSDILTQAAACNLMLVYYSGIKPVESYKVKLENICQSEAYKKARSKTADLSRAEQDLQAMYAKYFQEKNMAWWTTEIARLRQETKAYPDKEKISRDQRLLGYLSLVAFMNANSALNQNALPQAEEFLSLYAIIDPQNSEWAYLLAVLRMRENDNAHALESLAESVKLGFNDIDRIRNQKEFESLRNDAHFSEIIASIKPQ
jgi:poly(3-hydroxybutyrate) depolymerase